MSWCGLLVKRRGQLEALDALCSEMGEQPSDVALAWLLRQPVVTARIIGPRTIAQLDASMRALKIHLNEDALKQLDGIWPGPGGKAPKAYSW